MNSEANFRGQYVPLRAEPVCRAGQSFLTDITHSAFEAGGATFGAVAFGVPGAMAGAVVGHTVAKIITSFPSAAKEQGASELYCDPQNWEEWQNRQELYQQHWVEVAEASSRRLEQLQHQQQSFVEKYEISQRYIDQLLFEQSTVQEPEIPQHYLEQQYYQQY